MMFKVGGWFSSSTQGLGLGPVSRQMFYKSLTSFLVLMLFDLAIQGGP